MMTRKHTRITYVTHNETTQLLVYLCTKQALFGTLS